MDKKTLGKSVKIELNGSNQVYYQTLLGHTVDALHIANAYFNLKHKEIRNFCSRWDISESEFKKYTLLSVALHDVGKITKEFQNNIKNGKSSSDYPHSFWAIPILLSVFGIKLTDSPNFSIIDNKTLEFISILAVLGHHTQLHMQMYQYVNKNINFICDEIENFFSNLRKFFNQIKEGSISNMFGNLNRVCQNASSMGRYKVHNWIKRLSTTIIFEDENFDDSVRVKSVFSFLFSILQLADDYSSMNFSEFVMKNAGKNQQIFNSVLQKEEAQKYVPILDTGNIKDNVILNGKKLRKFQEDTKNSNEKFLFLFAPCGRGKTEASLLWAIEIMRKYHRDKIIFALPTQVTCNAMYERLVSEFGKEKVGLYHGRSFLVIDREEETEEGEDRAQNIKEETFKSSVFLKPVTVTTIDHLALSLIHGFSQADFATGNLQNSVIIFDEIHYYEQHTLEILISLFNILRKMDIPHILMTGTAPDFILKAVQDKYKIIEDKEGLDFKPFSVEKSEELLVFKEHEGNKGVVVNTKVFDSMKAEYINKKKIFVILNRVDFAQKFYLECRTYFESSGIKNPNIILYHSRFIYKDRIVKESEIKKCAAEEGKPCIIIATQVIEISLNISSNTMYSQIAPPDAVGQRAGRLHRGGRAPEGHILKLFSVKGDTNNSLPYDSDLLLKSWNEIKEGDKSYRQIKEICDKVYQGKKADPSIKYEEFFFKNILFGDIYYEVAHPDESGKGIKIREEKYLTINVIPSKFEQDVYSVSHIEEFECIIPYYIYSSKRDLFEVININDKKSAVIARLKYSYDTGLLPEKDENDFGERSY